MSKSKKISYAITLVFVVLLYAVVALLISQGTINRYYGGIITMICINVILTVSLNLASGFLGQLVLGHAGFMSVGAYTAALFTIHSGLPVLVSFPIALLLAGLVAALFSVIIGIPALRLRGDYLAIITMGFGEIIRVLILALPFTGGARGLIGIPAVAPRKSGINANILLFSYVFFLAVLTVYIIYSFIKSRHGRAVIAIREDEIAAEASGINTTYYKLLAFILAAFFAGIAGGLYAHHVGVLNPAKFDFNYSIEILVMVVLGGMGSITGSVISATVLTILPEALRQFSDYRMLVYSIILIIVMLFKPSGLLGQRELSIKKLVQRIFDTEKNTGKVKKEEG
ncbi:branched-chain amino acid ABC transporter permease [Caproiciproducens sp. LBM24188]